jgi:hypothetical protein
MKTVIVTLPMKKAVEKLRYPVAGNSEIEYDGEVCFPVNGVLARIMRPKDKVKLIFIVTRGGDDKGDEHRGNFLRELDEINTDIGAHITHETIELSFEPAKGEFNKLIRQLIDKIEDGSKVVADITFGSKPFPFVLLCAMNFAENFKNASVSYLVYGKVEFKGNEPHDPCLYDITSLYYMQKLIGAMEGRDPEAAKKILTDFFVL